MYFCQSALGIKMDQQIKLIKDINIGDTNWTSKVVVLEKGMPRDAKNSPTKYQIIIFADSEVILSLLFLII